MRLLMRRQRNARVTHFAKDYVNNINVTISIQRNAKVQLFLMFYIPEISKIHDMCLLMNQSAL